jgi:hypothetical protein
MIGDHVSIAGANAILSPPLTSLSTFRSSFGLRIEKPAGRARRLIEWRCRMGKRPNLLPLMIVVILELKVKIVIKIIVKKR